MRVIRPRKRSPSITIATWPCSNTGSSDSIGEVTAGAQGAGEDYVQGAKGVDGGAVLMQGAYAS